MKLISVTPLAFDDQYTDGMGLSEGRLQLMSQEVCHMSSDQLEIIPNTVIHRLQGRAKDMLIGLCGPQQMGSPKRH